MLALAIGFAVGAIISGAVTVYENKKAHKNWYDGLFISVLAGGIGGSIACIPIPGINGYVCAAIMGAAGNVVTELILGEIKNLDDLLLSIKVGTISGIIGNAAAELLSKGIIKYFNSLTKINQKHFLRGIGRISNAQLRKIRFQLRKGITPEIFDELANKYGYLILTSAFVSSTSTSAVS